MSERLTWNEAEAVVRAYRAEHGLSSGISVDALAQSLGTTPSEVIRLASPRRRFIDRSGVLSALLSFGVLALVALSIGPSYLARRSLGPVAPVARTTEFVIVADAEGRVHALSGEGPGPVETWTYPSSDPNQPVISSGKIL